MTSITNIDTDLYTPQDGVSRWFRGDNVTADAWGSNVLTDNTSAGTTSDAVYGTAKSFDGSDDEMTAADDASISGFSNGLTVSTWVNFDVVADDVHIITKGNELQGNNFEYSLGTRTADANLRFTVESSSSVTSTGYDYSNIDTGVWYYIVGTWKSGTYARLYVNGNIVDENTSSVITETRDISDSLEIADADWPFDGNLDDVRIYSRALSAHEVAQLYRQGHGRDLRPKVVQE